VVQKEQGRTFVPRRDRSGLCENAELIAKRGHANKGREKKGKGPEKRKEPLKYSDQAEREGGKIYRCQKRPYQKRKGNRPARGAKRQLWQGLGEKYQSLTEKVKT